MPARAVVFFLTASVFAATAAVDSNPRAAASNPVRIDRVEIAGDFVTVHFDMEAFRKYTVQAANLVPSANSNWVNVAEIPVYPFANHWVYAEPRTNSYRFYRLRVD
jgi:hypothetical protein